MSEEEKKAIKRLEQLYNGISVGVILNVKGDGPTCKSLETVLNLIEKQDKMIDYMAKHIDEQNDILADYDRTISYIPCNTDVPLNKCANDGCVICIKEYFRKRVEEDAKN